MIVKGGFWTQPAAWVAPAVVGLVWLSAGQCGPPKDISALRATASMVRSPTATMRASPTATPARRTGTRAQAEATATPLAAEAASGITITLFYDNNAYDDRLGTAWGFSCLVQGLEETILFDTGGDGALLLSNMRTLGFDPLDIDTVVISHIHADHLRGLSGFLAENRSVKVYLPQSFPQNTKASIARDADQVIEVHDPVEICKHAHSTGELGADIQEQSLVLETDQGLVVITGCAHPGIVSIVRRAKELWDTEIHLVLGGFHLGGTSASGIAQIIAEFQELGVQEVAPCHCSGDRARASFKTAYGEHCILPGVGSTLTVWDTGTGQAAK